MADNYGLSRDGFRRKRLPEIMTALADRISDKLGVDIERDSNSIFGQLIGVISYDLADIWEEAERIYNAMYPHTAEGVSLSNAAALAGIALIGAEQSTLYATCYGVEGTVIPYGSQIASSSDSVVYSSVEEIAVISAGKSSTVRLDVPNTASGTVYTLNVDGKSATYTAGLDDSPEIILNNLVVGLGELNDKTAVLDNGELVISMRDKTKAMAVTSENIDFVKIGTPVKFRCNERGAIDATIGTVTNIITAIDGWNEVSNEAKSVVGRDAETDIALRQRWSKSVYSRAAAMTDAIAAAIYDVVGVRTVKVYENHTDEVDSEGRLPHSIEAVVEGGDESDIAAAIWRCKAAGIDTFGTVSAETDDSQGITHTMKFSRPEAVQIWLKVVVGENPDEHFPLAGISDVAKAVLEKGNSHKIGEDVILQRFFGTIFNAATGVGYINITAKTSADSPYTTENIVINARQVAVFDASRIEVTKT